MSDRTRLTAKDVVAARRAIAGIAIETPVLRSEGLARLARADVLLKLENLQVTGSFKVRGAANKLLSLTEDQRARGVVACSSGNHGLAVAYVAKFLGIPATICVPEWVDRAKLAAIRRYGAEAIVQGKSYDEAEARSLAICDERELVYVHPFDDLHVIAGQGTVGLELLDQIPGLDAVLVPVSGGGLIGGVGYMLKSRSRSITVIGVSAANARVMYESLKAGRPMAIPEERTVASALSGGIGVENRHTFRLVQEHVDEHVLVSEEEIGEAMSFAVAEHRLAVEGGGAVVIAALLSGRCTKGASIAAVISGGNIEAGALSALMSEV